MIKVNLLNWRGKQVEILNNRFYFVVGVVVAITILFNVVIFAILSSLISGQNANTVYLQSEITPIESKIVEIKDLQSQKDLLLNRRKIIQSLQTSRPFVVNLFDNLVRVMPDDVILTDLSRKGNDILISGVSESNYSVSVLMENVQHLSWVQDAKLGELIDLTVASSSKKKGEEETDVQKAIETAGKVGFTLDIIANPIFSGVENAAATKSDKPTKH